MGINENEIPYKVEELDKRVEKLDKKQEGVEEILTEIREGFVSIKDALVSNKEQEGLRNQLLEKDIEGMKTRIDKLEANQRWLVMAILGEVLSIIFGIIMIFINKGF